MQVDAFKFWIGFPSSLSLSLMAELTTESRIFRRMVPSFLKFLENGASGDELVRRVGVLQKLGFFWSELGETTDIFCDAVNEMQKPGCQTFDAKNLAEILKSRGNKAMLSKLYSQAIKLYSFAIAVCEDNAVFYCNRAAAYTKIKKYPEAIGDCLKSIEIDPNYVKAFSRLGSAYYAQGNYTDAIEKGFKKALQLDPQNESVKESIRAAKQKLREEREQQKHSQNTNTDCHQQSCNHSTWDSRGQAAAPYLWSMPYYPHYMCNLHGYAFPLMPWYSCPAYTSMYTNMYTNMPGYAYAFQGEDFHDNPNWQDEDVDATRIGDNTNIHCNCRTSPDP